jgi:medium-chain acyl-[acyl-carrier-protein] hydrolase
MTKLKHKLSSRWFESLSTTYEPLLRLFCFPYAGGSAHVFREWQRYLAPEIDVCLVHLPGRAQRICELPHTRLLALVEEVADAIGTQIDEPFAFYGHSMGGLISFELARELRRRRCEIPVHLFVSAHPSPVAKKRLPHTFNLPLPEFIAEIRKFNGTPKELFDYPELQEAWLPLLRADFEMTDTYEYLADSALGCPIMVYGGEKDEIVSAKNLAAWGQLTSAKCEIRIFPGDHFFIQNHKTEFVRVFRQDLLRTLCIASIH